MLRVGDKVILMCHCCKKDTSTHIIVEEQENGMFRLSNGYGGYENSHLNPIEEPNDILKELLNKKDLPKHR